MQQVVFVHRIPLALFLIVFLVLVCDYGVSVADTNDYARTLTCSDEERVSVKFDNDGGIVKLNPLVPGSHTIFIQREIPSQEEAAYKSGWLTAMQDAVVEGTIQTIEGWTAFKDKLRSGNLPQIAYEAVINAIMGEKWTVLPSWHSNGNGSKNPWDPITVRFDNRVAIQLITGEDVDFYTFEISPEPGKKAGTGYFWVECHSPEATVNTIGVRLRVRYGPGLQYSTVDHAKPGSVLRAYGRNPDSTWVRVLAPNGQQRGWVYANLVSLNVPMSSLPIIEGGDTVPSQTGRSDITTRRSQVPSGDSDDSTSSNDTGHSAQIRMPEYQPNTENLDSRPIALDTKVINTIAKPSCTDEATFVEQSQYPTVQLDIPFNIYFEVRNSGTCTWSNENGYSLGNSNGYVFGAEASQRLNQVVDPGESIRWTIPMLLPRAMDGLSGFSAEPGTQYQTDWYVMHDSNRFGPRMFAVITLGADVPKPIRSNPVPSSGSNEFNTGGGVNIDGYCRQKGHVGASLTEHTAHGWRCVGNDGSLHDVDMYELCSWVHSAGSTPEYTNFSDPFSWVCGVSSGSNSQSVVLPEPPAQPDPPTTPSIDLSNKYVDFNWDGVVDERDVEGYQAQYAECKEVFSDICRWIDLNDDDRISIDDWDIFVQEVNR